MSQLPHRYHLADQIILAARRTCPICKREMFIDNGTAVKMPEGELKEAVEVDPLSCLEAEESMNPAVAKKLAKALQRLVSALEDSPEMGRLDPGGSQYVLTLGSVTV